MPYQHMPSHVQQETYMQQALELARKGAGQVSPNPMVGAVLVKGGQVVGEGYHEQLGGPHAEVNALNLAGDSAQGADLYVTLEPCSHHGKTPPCVDAVIKAGVGRVFVGMVDPNPAVSGEGVRKMREAGISVEVGLLEDTCRRLNEAFIKYITGKTPFVLLKAALTLDGKIATYTGDSKWITCEESRRRVHRIRAEVDAVIVGVGTVIADDPQLTVRMYEGPYTNPLRVVIDSSLRIPVTSRMLQPDMAAETLIVTAPQKAESKKALGLIKRGARVIGVPEAEKGIDLAALMLRLGEEGIASALLEGGAEINASALASGIVDKVMLFYAPKIAGGKDAISFVGGEGVEKIADSITLNGITVSRSECDVVIEGYVENQKP